MILRHSKSILCLGVSLLIAWSCSLDDGAGIVSDGGAPDTIFVTLDHSSSQDLTRVYLGDDLKLHFNEADQISFFNKEIFNYRYQFQGKTGDRSGYFAKVKTQFHVKVDIGHVYSVYPYSESNAVDENTEALTIVLPAEQAYSEGSFGLGANTMVSAGNDSTIAFKNVGGYFCIKLYGKGFKVSSVSLSGNGGEKIAGKATVTMEVGGLPQTTMDGSATDKITITCDEPVSLGESPEESTPFWFVVPPVEFAGGFTVTVTFADGKTFSKTTTKDITIERNIMTGMVPLEVYLHE